MSHPVRWARVDSTRRRRLWCAMSNGKISAEIAAATDKVAASLRTDIALAINAVMQVVFR